ncbi:MAG: STAS domain-containing protein [Candidatus Aquicultor sp.]
MLDIDIKSSSNPNIHIITLSGEFGLYDQKRVESFLPETAIDDLQCMIFDLTAVAYMEEAGFETLMRYLQELTRIGACMAVIIQPESALMRKLKRMGFFDIGLKVGSSFAEIEKALQDGGCK